MSGSDDGSEGDGQGGQPQEGQAQGAPPQGGQPQGGQPQGAPPQGGQPQGQPQGGQPVGENLRRQKPQSQNNIILGYKQEQLVNFAKFGAVLYTLFGIGVIITQFLTLSLAGDEALIGLANSALNLNGEELFRSSLSGYNTMLTSAPLFAVAFGLYYYHDSETMGPTYTPTMTATVVGTAIGSILSLLLMIIFAPEGSDLSFGAEITAILGALIGTAITGGAIGFVLDEYI
jgi:hypothetical protein